METVSTITYITSLAEFVARRRRIKSNCFCGDPRGEKTLLRARAQPVNMRASAKQRGCDRGTRSNGCEFVLLQLFAYYVALQRGLDIDKPRNLAKSVTVE